MSYVSQVLKLCFTIVMSAIIVAAGYLMYLDNKRISNPNYRADLMKRRRLLKTKKLQKRLSELPKPHDAKGIKQFVLNKFRRAVQLTCTIDGQEEAAENMADALCALSVSEADRILNCMKYHSKIERKTYDLMCEKYAEMKNFKISCMITNDNKPDRI